jgi:MFS family permease
VSFDACLGAFADHASADLRRVTSHRATRHATTSKSVFLGGVITEWISWPWVFYVNIPIALAVLAVTPAVPARHGSIDIAGAITAMAGLAATVFAIVRAPEEG